MTSLFSAPPSFQIRIYLRTMHQVSDGRRRRHGQDVSKVCPLIDANPRDKCRRGVCVWGHRGCRMSSREQELITPKADLEAKPPRGACLTAWLPTAGGRLTSAEEACFFKKSLGFGAHFSGWVMLIWWKIKSKCCWTCSYEVSGRFWVGRLIERWTSERNVANSIPTICCFCAIYSVITDNKVN